MERKRFMVRQQTRTYDHKNGNIYNFIEYKRKKPFFDKPMKITVGDPINDTYYMVENVFYKGKQFLALNTEHDRNTIVLVEAKIENGKLMYISKLTEDVLVDISSIFEAQMI